MKIKPRNAYAIPAKHRGNAGAMVHKNPPRQRSFEVGLCILCGQALDIGDESDICIECELDDSRSRSRSAQSR